MTHIVVNPHHDSFGPYHEDPRTGEPWTEETARQYAKACAGSSRSGGIGCDITKCSCDREVKP